MPNYGFNGQLEEILSRAASDRDFREGLLRDPSSTLEKTLGQLLPSNLKVKFVTKDPDCDAMFVLPDPLSDELSHEDLDTVSGGQTADTTTASDVNGIWAWSCPSPPKNPD